MNYEEYVDFDDFCSKNNFTPKEGIEHLEKELEKQKKEKFDINNYPKTKKLLETPGMTIDLALVFTDIQIKKLKGEITMNNQAIIQQLRLRKEFLCERTLEASKEPKLELAKRYLTMFYAVTSKLQ